MKKVLCFLLLITLVSVGFIACGGGGEEELSKLSAETAAGKDGAGILSETVYTGDVPEIEYTDYDGRQFTILYSEWSLYNDYYFAEEANGESMNDAVYERTAKINELLNIDITARTLGYIDTVLPEVRKVVMAGLDTYDLALIHCASDFIPYIKEDLVVNWNKIPSIDMTKSYWNDSVKRTIQANGMLAYAVNDYIIPDVNSIFFNKILLESLHLEVPYEIVKNGKWVWDKLIEMAAAASKDLNGDGVFDDQDQYGLVGERGWQNASITTGCGQMIIEINSAGEPVLAINTERMVGIMEKLYKFVRTGNNAYMWDYKREYDPNANGTPPVDFNAGKALYYLVPLSLANRFRALDVEFGILPMPKYNEEQNDYITLNWSGYMTVPMTAGDLEFTGKVVELLGYYNKQIVTPAFYDILLGQKISRDVESAEMLNIIFGNTVYDLGVGLGLYMVTANVLSSSDGNFVSLYAKNEKAWLDTIKKYGEACSEYMEIHS